MNLFINHLHVFNADKIMVNSFNGGEQSDVNFSKVENMENVQDVKVEEVKEEEVKEEDVKEDGAGVKESQPTETAESKDRDSELIARLMPIFWNDHDAVTDFISKVTKVSDREVINITIELVKKNVISVYSCRKPLWEILFSAGIYTSSLSYWCRFMKDNTA